MTSDKQDHNQASPPIEDRLRQALHSRAEQVQPSAEAFFTINRRISRREAASPWHPRTLWEKRAQLSLQPSMVLSLVLLVALTAVTTILLTQNNSAPENITTATGPTESSIDSASIPTSGTPEPPGPGNSEVSSPVNTTPGVDIVVAPPNTQDPTTVTERPTTTTATTTTTTVPDTPDTADLLEVHPLQVASNGFPQIYAEHRIDSEYITHIPVSADPDFFKTTRVPALDREGLQWIEVINSAGDTGWVQSRTVSVQPQEGSTIDHSEGLAATAQSLVDFAATASSTEIDAETKRNIARTLPLSSRGIYFSMVDSQGVVYGYQDYAPDLVKDYLLNASSDSNNNSILQVLATALNCISQAPSEAAAPTGLKPPAALHRLSHATLAGAAGCHNLLVYFDFLQAKPEIIAISIHIQ